MRRLTASLLLLASCGGTAGPVEIDVRTDACAWCRMAVSDVRTAAQLVAPLEEPRLFDDIGCLRDYLAAAGAVPADSAAYVADHRTGAWIAAAGATYVQVPTLTTPMGSGILAWADAASRASDTAVPKDAPPRTPAQIFGAHAPPGSRP